MVYHVWKPHFYKNIGRYCSLPDNRCDTKKTIPKARIVQCHIHGGDGFVSCVDRVSSCYIVFPWWFHSRPQTVRYECSSPNGKRKASPKDDRRMLFYSVFLLFHTRCGGAILSDPRKVRTVVKNGGGSYHIIEYAVKTDVYGAPLAHRSTCTQDGYGKSGRSIQISFLYRSEHTVYKSFHL